MDNQPTNVTILEVELRHIKATLDEIRKEDLPLVRHEVRQAIQDEIVPLQKRVMILETEMRIIDKRVWVMFGAAALVVPTLVGSLITLGLAYLANGGGLKNEFKILDMSALLGHKSSD